MYYQALLPVLRNWNRMEPVHFVKPEFLGDTSQIPAPTITYIYHIKTSKKSLHDMFCSKSFRPIVYMVP
jgi:hypothetical protein